MREWRKNVRSEAPGRGNDVKMCALRPKTPPGEVFIQHMQIYTSGDNHLVKISSFYQYRQIYTSTDNHLVKISTFYQGRPRTNPNSKSNDKNKIVKEKMSCFPILFSEIFKNDDLLVIFSIVDLS